jgi:type I restriction enzyme, S subunit
MPQLGELNRGKSTHRPRDDARLYGGRYPFIQTGDIRRSGGTITEFTQTYSEFGMRQSRLWPTGTLCITIAANIAETGILTFPACFPDSVVGFVHNGNPATTRYVEFFLRTAKSKLERYAPATAQKNINLKTLASVAIPLPPLAEQIRVVSETERRLTLLKNLEATARDNLSRAKRLKGSILNAASEGRLVEHSPADESAQIFLQRMRENRVSVPVSRVPQTSKETQSMKRESVKTLQELIDQLKKLGRSSSPERLLLATNLEDDVERFFELLRQGMREKKLTMPIGRSGSIRVK